MRRINFVITDDLERALRSVILQRYGGRKGDLSKAITEALRMWIDVDPSAWALYKQANDSRLIASERKGAIDLLAEKGYSTNPKRTDWMLATTANDPTLMPSERSHIYQLMRKGLQSQQGDL